MSICAWKVCYSKTLPPPCISVLSLAGILWPTATTLRSLRDTAIHWEEQLTNELPSMIDRINATTNKLKELEDEFDDTRRGDVEEIGTDPTKKGQRTLETQSEPKGKSKGTLSRSRDLVQRSPSPTESNISVPRDPTLQNRNKGKRVVVREGSVGRVQAAGVIEMLFRSGRPIYVVV